MPHYLSTPFDRQEGPAFRGETRTAEPWQHRAKNLCYMLVKAAGFLGSTYLMTLGLPLLFFLLLSQGSVDAFFAQLSNLSDRFLAADAARRAVFVQELALGLIGVATLLAIWRLPRFLNEVADALSEERP